MGVLGKEGLVKYFRGVLTAAIIVFALSAVLFVVSFWTGETLGGEIYTCRLILILMLLSLLVPLLRVLDRGTIQRRLWSIITLAMLLAGTAVTLETINAYAGREVIAEGAIFLIYLLVFIPILVLIVMLYFGYRSMGFEFNRDGFLRVLPSMLILAGATIAVVIVPLALSSGDLAVRISDIFSLVVQLLALMLVSFLAITLGRGRMGRPWLFLSLALVVIVLQTILTAQLRMVGMVRSTELADLLVHLGYLFLIIAACYQYEIVTQPL
jgi:hypothetical protein